MKKQPLLIDNFAVSSALLIGSIIAGVAGVASSLINRSSQSSTNETNKQLQESANAANVNLWREQTEYNNPQNTMERLRVAGLNPNLAISNGFNGSAAASAPQMLAPKLDAPQLDTSSIASAANIASQTNLNNALADKARSDAKVNDSVVDVNTSTIKLNDWTIDMQQQLTPVQVDLLKSSLDKSKAETDEVVQKIQNLKKDFDILSEHQKQEVINTAYYEMMKKEEMRNLISRTNLNEAQIKSLFQEMLWRPRLWQSTISLQSAESNLAKSNARLSDTQRTQIANEINEWISPTMRSARFNAAARKSYEDSRFIPTSDNTPYGFLERFFFDGYLYLNNAIKIFPK